MRFRSLSAVADDGKRVIMVASVTGEVLGGCDHDSSLRPPAWFITAMARLWVSMLDADAAEELTGVPLPLQVSILTAEDMGRGAAIDAEECEQS